LPGLQGRKILKEKIISFIGCGNMGEAILKGLLGSSFLKASEVGFFEKDAARRDLIKNIYQVDAADDVCSASVISKYLLIAVKPQNIAQLMDELKECFKPESNCIISILAGISTSYFEKNLGNGASVIRVMPNTPALYNKGMVTISPGKNAEKKDLDFVKGLMDKIGSSIVIEEDLQHISTAINGSGPAYFFLFCKALIEAAVNNGLDPDTARKLAADTMIGSGEMIKRSQMDLEELISRVASPGGTTEKALLTFSNRKFEKIVAEAVENALKRSMELEREMI
jgi:pyrroline-5-carboxylate reductase